MTVVMPHRRRVKRSKIFAAFLTRFAQMERTIEEEGANAPSAPNSERAEAIMLANSLLLQQPPSNNDKLDQQVLRNAARRGAVSPLLSLSREETDRVVLVEYAVFLLEQEARYCQQ